MTPAIKNGGWNKYYTALQEVCSTFSQNLRMRKVGVSGVSLCSLLSLWSKTFCFPEVCYYRPSSWVAVQSGACSYKPWGFKGNRWPDWVAFTRGISRSGAWWVGPPRLTCVGPGCLWRWWWGQVSWLWNIGQTECRMRRPWSCKSLMGLMLFYSPDNFLIILYNHHFPDRSWSEGESTVCKASMYI